MKTTTKLMSPDAILRAFLGSDLQAHGAIALPLPPRVPSFGAPRLLHSPPAGMPAVNATIAPAARRAA